MSLARGLHYGLPSALQNSQAVAKFGTSVKNYFFVKSTATLSDTFKRSTNFRLTKHKILHHFKSGRGRVLHSKSHWKAIRAVAETCF